MRRHIRARCPRSALLLPRSTCSPFLLFRRSSRENIRYIFMAVFYLFYSWGLPEKLLAILIPFDRVEGTIAHLVAAEQFGLLCDIDNTRDGQAR